MQQGIAPTDLCSHLTEPKEHPEVMLKLPAEFLEPQEYNLGRFRGHHHAKAGEFLIPDHHTKDVVQSKRQEIFDAEWFLMTKQAQTAIHALLKQYNHIRPQRETASSKNLLKNGT